MDAARTAFERWFAVEHVELVLSWIFEIDGYLAEPLLERAVAAAPPAHVESLVLDGKSFVIDPQGVQDGGVQVVDVNGVFENVVTKSSRKEG